MENENNVLRELLAEISTLLAKYPKALELRAVEVEASGKDPELAAKLMKGVDAMRDSGNLYITWARHFAGLSEGTSDASDEDDESAIFDV